LKVVPAWRDAYAMACLHVADIKSSEGERHEALRTLDMGLIMGGPLLRAELDAAINRINAAPLYCQEPAINEVGSGSNAGADSTKWEEDLCRNKDPKEVSKTSVVCFADVILIVT
jgi:[histone H3]-dimethyl/trimethyl-L-lysine36 demethylase